MPIRITAKRSTLPKPLREAIRQRRYWKNPQNPTIIGYADKSGRLIPGSIWSGGLSESTIKTIEIAKQTFKGQITDMGINPESTLAKHFLEKMDPSFWLWSTSNVTGISMSQENKEFLSGIPTSAFIKIMDAQSRVQDPNKEKGFIIEKDSARGILMVVNRDYAGSMEETFRLLQKMDIEIGSFRNFVMAGEGKAMPDYAFSFICPKNHLYPQTSAEEKEEIENQQKTIMQECSGFLSLPPDKIQKAVQNYFAKTIPEAVSGRTPSEIAQTIHWFSNLSETGVQCKVIYDNSHHIERNTLDAPRLAVSIKNPFVTSSVIKICNIIKTNEYDIRQMSIECQDNQATRENLAILTFVLKKLNSTREAGEGDIKPVDGSLLKQKIEALFNPTLGIENLTNILGPIMIGSSSSHTAGAARIGRYARRFIEAAIEIGWIKQDNENPLGMEIQMRNTFALHKTGGGHYSADAVIAGLMEENNDVTEENSDMMHTAMEKLADAKKIITIRGLPFSLGPKKEAEKQLENPIYAKHNQFKINIVSKVNEKYYENQLSIRIKGPNNSHSTLSISLDSVGGSIIKLQRIRYNPGENNPKNTLLYSSKMNFSLSGDKPCYFLNLKNEIQFQAESFSSFLKDNGIDVAKELIGDKLADKKAIFFATSEPIPDPVKTLIEKEYGKLVQIDPIGQAPKTNVAIPFSDFETLLNVLNKKIPIGGHACSSLSEAAIAYQEAVFGNPEETTRKYYRKVLNVMFLSVKDGLNNTKPLHTGGAFDCCWRALPPEKAPKIDMGRNSTKVKEKYFTFPIESSEKLFELIDATFRFNRPNAQTILFATLDPIIPETPPVTKKGDKEKIEKWHSIFADPTMSSILERYRNDLYYRKMLGTLGSKDRIIVGFFNDLKKAWEQNPFTHNIYSLAQAYALAVNENSAKRGIMVAAPTAGSCGVIPGALKAIDESFRDEEGAPLFKEKHLVDALLTASLVGLLFNDKLKTSGGTGGCQAEIGASVAMATAAATQLMGGTLTQIYNAISFALKQCEGMTCTPVGGHVITPCIVRNGLSAQVALGATNMAISGAESFLSPDSMMAALVDVAQHMHTRFKETGEGGCANSPCALKIVRKINGE